MNTKIYLKKFASICKRGTYADFNKLCRQKGSFIPAKLYKYSTLNPWVIKNLQRKQIYLSSPEDFNDPFDTFNVGHELQESALKRLEIMTGIPLSTLLDDNRKEQFGEVINDGYKEHPGFRNATGVCCFTEKSPDNIIMWSHYANQHKGICLEYDFAKHNDIIRSLYPVLYRDKYIIRKLPEKPKEHILYDRDQVMLLLIQAHLVKSTEWEHEKEWRFLRHINDGNREINIALNPTHIYLGLNIDKLPDEEQSILRHLKQFAEKNYIPISQMKRSKNEYSLYPTKSE
ncbi:MAG: DUF2971 domain-containing protein [Coriobacteriia bacterium]|nr:DUF2971 domain-containing protein [Coriobacteriia bacterium]